MVQGTERQCAACGKPFTGRYRKCYECRAADRTCTECGAAFRGTHHLCAQCIKAERQCAGCGAPISSRYRECKTCRTSRATPNTCQFPGCENPKVHVRGARFCQQHRDEAYQRKLARLRKTTCYMPGCDEPKVAGVNPAGRHRPYRYCAKHSAEGPARERAQIARRARERTYGITHEQYLAMLEAQGGVCAICGNGNDGNRQLSIDHDHVTGAIRDLLCDRCNPMLGYARDSIAILETAIKYLKRHKAAG